MGRRRKKNTHLPQRMYLRSGSYYFVEYGTDRWINLGRSYIEAMTAYAQHFDTDRSIYTVEDLISRYMAEVAPTKRERTYKDNLRESKYLRAAFGKMRPDEVTARGIYAYLDDRGKRSPTRANREVALLSHIFTKAIRWGVADNNPCKGVERHPEKPRQRYVTDQEYNAFKEFAGDQMSAYMDFKLLTGLRVSDILQLRKDQLKTDGIHVTISKTGKKIIISWSDELRDSIEAIRKLKRPFGSMYLFST